MATSWLLAFSNPHSYYLIFLSGFTEHFPMLCLSSMLEGPADCSGNNALNEHGRLSQHGVREEGSRKAVQIHIHSGIWQAILYTNQASVKRSLNALHGRSCLDSVTGIHHAECMLVSGIGRSLWLSLAIQWLLIRQCQKTCAKQGPI